MSRSTPTIAPDPPARDAGRPTGAVALPSPANEALVGELRQLIAQIQALMPRLRPPDWEAAVAFRWRRQQSALGVQAWLEPVRHRAEVLLDDLHNIEEQKAVLVRNTRQFIEGRAANNALLSGSRGTGKSSMVKALLNAFHPQGLRLIEVDKSELLDLPDIVALLAQRPERFLIFCDDLSFEEGESAYKALKSVLDGSVAAQTDNVLIYATSNRRHLMPEYMRENLATHTTDDGEIHPGETVEEKISLSERFGLWVPFYPFTQDHYLEAATHWLLRLGASRAQADQARSAALQFALERGSRSGRVAWQFARDWIGQHGHRRRSRRSA